MKVAIIGCGYVGEAVARYWNPNHFITATTTNQERTAELEQVAHRVMVISRDNETDLKAVLEDQEAVLLSIAPGGQSQVDAQKYRETYLYTAKNLIWALQQVPTVKQLIYTSSYAVYGNTNNAWVDEASRVVPVNERGEILHQTEEILLQLAPKNLKVCVLRLGGIYGPGRELVKMFSRFAGTIRPGDGEYFTNWIHRDDVVSAINFALVQRLEGIYNLVDDQPQMTRQLVERVCKQYNLPSVSWDASQPNLRPYSVRVSNQKLKAAGYPFIHPEIKM